MAYRRCLSIRAALLARRSNSSFCYISHEDDRHDFSKRKEMAFRHCISVQGALFAHRSSTLFGYFSRENDRDKPKEFRSNIQEYVTQRRSLESNVKSGSWRYRVSFFREGSGLAGAGLWMDRYMSTSVGDVATVLTDAPTEAVASQVPAMSEVAIAAADSALPVAALQYLIDGVHSFTGLNWWASIALTTVLFRGATIPFLIHESKIITKAQSVFPSFEEVREMLQATDPSARNEMRSKLDAFLKEYGRTTLYMTLLIQGLVFFDFYFAITNMAEKVPSFKNGGALWFTDLTTPDAMFILPLLTALPYWFDGENFSANIRYRTVVAVLFSTAALSFMNFPQALYCHWITSNAFNFDHITTDVLLHAPEFLTKEGLWPKLFTKMGLGLKLLPKCADVTSAILTNLLILRRF